MWKSPSTSQGLCWSCDRQVLEGLGVGAGDTAASSLPSKEGLPAQQPQQVCLCFFLPHVRSLLQVLLQGLVASYRERWEHILAVPARFSSLSSKIFRALAMVYKPTKLFWGLTPQAINAVSIDTSQVGECYSSTHCALYGLYKWKYLLLIIAKVLLFNKPEVTEPHHVQTSGMLEILEMFTDKYLLKVKLICMTEHGYKYWKAVFNRASSCQIWVAASKSCMLACVYVDKLIALTSLRC